LEKCQRKVARDKIFIISPLVFSGWSFYTIRTHIISSAAFINRPRLKHLEDLI